MQGVRIAAKRGVKSPETLANQRRAVDVERRAFGVGDRLKLDAVAHEMGACTEESSHESTNDYTT